LKKRPRGGLLWYVAVILCACGEGVPPVPEGEAGAVVQVSPPPEELNQIIRQARETIPEFIQNLNHPEPDMGNFQVKYPFAADPESGFSYEHLWLGDLRAGDGFYYGTLSNEPRHCDGLTRGAEVPFLIENISDWMYTREEDIIGGRSIKFLIEGISEPERNAEMTAYYKKFQ
jgi:uncharacterized protein YegJ (DUF2314 family)